MNKLVELGHKVTYHTPNIHPCGTFRKYGDKNILVEDCKTLHEACDILVLYSNDWVWDFNKSEICDIFSNINASRKVFCVNYRIGDIGLIEWTRGWNLYLFLNSNLEEILLERYIEAKTKVMAPPTDLTKYFEIIPNYNNGLRLIRHSSQGDAKYPKNFNEIIERILNISDDISIRLMPAPSFIGNFDSRVFIHQRNNPSINEFLKLGNCFFYMLPENYSEGGPKVVMEAQAAGLSVIADNHSGMKDRVIEGTGWLANSIKEYLDIIKNITVKKLSEYGSNAREYARVAYNPMNWIENILGEYYVRISSRTLS
jgi:glycosyltransferase involved in cell wall biosynthesis